MAYKVEMISPKTKEKLMERLYSPELYERKAALHGTCIKFFTDNMSFKDMWEDNFEPMPDWVRPHGRLFSVNGKRLRVRYEPHSKTAIVQGCDYYGWVKSIALAIAADFLEDFTSEHRRYSVHGSFVDLGGKGVAIVGPSKSGKTTLTYGLLMEKGYHFLTDDWFFVRLTEDDARIYSSERNTYIRDDLGKVWKCYAKKLKGMKKDAKRRAVIDVKRLLGGNKIRGSSTLGTTVLLTRDKKLPPLTRLTKQKALKFMADHDFCNPHQLVRTKEKMEKRRKFFAELFTMAPVYLLNTIETPQESLDRLKGIVEKF